MRHSRNATIHIAALLLLFFIFINQNLSAQQIKSHSLDHYQKTAKEIVESALIHQTAYNWLGELVKIGPRLSGSENSLKAIKWAEKKFGNMGFDSVWLQPAMVPHWIRGDKEEAVISDSKNYKDKNLNICSLGGSVGTPVDGITAEVLEVKSFKDLEKKKEQAKGKIVFFNYPFKQTFVQTFPGYGDAVSYRVFGASKAAEAGAVASIIRSVTTKYDNVPHTGVLIYDTNVVKIPHSAMGLIDADFLSEALKKEPHLKLTINMSCKTLPDVQSYNVIGEIKGTEKPNDIVLVGGHFDSWDKGVGAHDDGGPALQCVEVLDLFKRLNIHPKRTIRFILFINEENGGRGAREYAEFAKNSSENHIAAIESDAGVFTPRSFSVTTDSTRLEKIRSWLPILHNAMIERVEKGGSGADVSKIKNAKALIGYRPDSQRYFDYHHSDNDVYSAVNPREMELGASAIAILAYLLSEEGL